MFQISNVNVKKASAIKNIANATVQEKNVVKNVIAETAKAVFLHKIKLNNPERRLKPRN